MLPDFFEFQCPTRVVFGPGMIADIQAELDALAVKRLFLVSDRALEETGLVSRAIEGIAAAGVEVAGTFLDVPTDSEVAVVGRCAEAAREAGADGLIAVGGGSVIDTAKAANILFSEGGDLVRDYSGANTLSRPLKPFIAVPTTAGTGSEVTAVAVIYDSLNHVKSPFSDRFLLPALAVLDPELTLSLPAGLTASTAMDALTHALEAYVGPQASPLSDAAAEGAVRLVFEYVERAVTDGNDLEARGGLLTAATMAGIAFNHSMVGCVHGMAHSVGALCHVPHGVANAVLLPFGLEYNLEFTAEKLARLAPTVGATATEGTDEKARAVVAAVRDLTGRLAAQGVLPLSLRDAGVPDDMLPDIAEATVMDGTSFYNPREVVAQDILETLERAY